MESLNECYSVCGTGGWESCIVIQERLQDYGLCSYLRWDPDPHYRGTLDEEPQVHWRFFYETDLKRSEALSLLGAYATRYDIQFR